MADGSPPPFDYARHPSGYPPPPFDYAQYPSGYPIPSDHAQYPSGYPIPPDYAQYPSGYGSCPYVPDHWPKDQHQVKCNGCGVQRFIGPRFNCNQCHEYNLCDRCYKDSEHIDTEHHFKCYESPNALPVNLPVRPIASPRSPPPPPPLPQEATRTNTTDTTTAGTAPAPPPHPAAPLPSKLDNMPLSSAPNANPVASTFFYQDMSIPKMQAFLEEHDVPGSEYKLLDQEALSRLVWETHCDGMSNSELKTFLSSRNISTDGCKSTNDRRGKAKAAFEPLVRPPPARNTGSSGGWRKDDNVVLKGLSQADLNGKLGTIWIVDVSAGRAKVWVSDLWKALWIEYENLAPNVVSPRATGDKAPGGDSGNVRETNRPPPAPTVETPTQPASSTVTAKARGIIYSESGGRFVAIFMIDEIQYTFAGACNPNPGTFKVNRATLEYDSKGELTGTRPLKGTVGISKVKLKIDNGPVASGDLPIDNYIDPASTIIGTGTWTTA